MSDHPAPQRGASAAPSYQVLLVAALAAALCEGVDSAVAALTGDVGVGAALLVLWQASGTVLVPLAILVLPVGFLLDRDGTRALGRDLRRALTGDAEGHGLTASLSIAAGLAIFGGSASIATLVGRAFKDQVSTNVTVTLSVVAALLSLGVLFVFVGLVSRLAGAWVVRRAVQTAPSPVPAYRAFVAPILLASVVSVGLLILFPATFVVTLGGGVFGLAIASVPRVHGAIDRILPGGRGLAILGAAFVIGVSAPLMIGRMPTNVVQMVLYRAPVSGILLAAARPRSSGASVTALASGGSAPDPGTWKRIRQGPVTRPKRLPPRENVVMFVVDAMRPDHLSAAGYKRKTSPQLDKFLETATWFRNAYAAATSTRFSLSAIFTGMEVDEIPQSRGPGIDLEVLPGVPTIASRLGDVGYLRNGISDSYVIQHIRGLGAGFQHWDTPYPVDDWAANYPVTATKDTNAAAEWLSHTPDDGSKPFFLFVHYRCTHDPYAKNAKWPYGSNLVDEYDSALSYCDDEIGRLLDILDTRRDKDRTAVIAFSDHGELFGEHGFTNHGNTLYEPDARSFLAIRVPGIQQVKTVTAPVSLMDIEPTTLMLAGAMPDVRTTAYNLLPFLMDGDKAADPKRPLFMYADLSKGWVRHQSRAVLLGHYKFIRDVSTNATELYDIASDPGERYELSLRLPAVRRELAAELEGWERDVAQHEHPGSKSAF